MSDSVNLDGDTQAVRRWIWRNLVPESGQADTVQGELLRALERLRWEVDNNGNANWDDGFEMFIKYLDATLSSESRLPADMHASIKSDLAVVAEHFAYVEEDVFERLTEAVVAYCRLNPTLIQKAADPLLHR